MSKIINIFWREPVVTLSITTGTAAVLAEQHLIPAWVPLIVLAVVTPIQRAAVIPVRHTVAKIQAKVNGGTDAS